MSGLNQVDIDLDALGGNLAALRKRIGPSKSIIASLKANAYGHGIVPVARQLATAGVEMLATGSLADAVAMREAGIETPILMFGTSLPPVLSEFRRFNLIATIHNREMADAAANAGGSPFPVFIKVDCGLGRLGLPLSEARRFIIETARWADIEIVGIYSHLPFADVEGRDWARARTVRFDDLVAALERDGVSAPVTQIGASASIMAGFQDRCTAVCPGGILYGYAPFDGADMTGFQPVMSRLVTRLIHVSPNAADRTPGHEGRYASRVTDMTGVVPFGRLQGNRPPLQEKSAHMLVRGAKAPILDVSLEHCVLDLSDVPDPQLGEEVVIIGESGSRKISLEDMAVWWGRNQ